MAGAGSPGFIRNRTAVTVIELPTCVILWVAPARRRHGSRLLLSWCATEPQLHRPRMLRSLLPLLLLALCAAAPTGKVVSCPVRITFIRIGHS